MQFSPISFPPFFTFTFFPQRLWHNIYPVAPGSGGGARVAVEVDVDHGPGLLHQSARREGQAHQRRGIGYISLLVLYVLEVVTHFI